MNVNLRSLATSLVVASFLSSILVYPLIPEDLSRFFLASYPLWLALFMLPVLMLLALLLFRGEGQVRSVFVIVLILSLLHAGVLLDNTSRVADLGVTILNGDKYQFRDYDGRSRVFWNEDKTKPGVRSTNEMGIKQ